MSIDQAFIRGAASHMRTRAGRGLVAVTATLLLLTGACPAGAGELHRDGSRTAIAWAPSLQQSVFDAATDQHRFVLLDLHAVWCHWCHVMDEQTYADGDVTALIAEHYIAVSVDADSDPGLASRYGDWGWPATIVLAADGTEIVKRRGFIAPAQMASLLRAIVDDPSPGPSVLRDEDRAGGGASALTVEQRSGLLHSYEALYDDAHGGWGTVHKYLDAATIDLEFARINDGNSAAERRARQTLDANLNLIDPVWGGVYQYSDAEDWRSPHFEKLIAFQADDLRLYSEAFARWHDRRYLEAARAIRGYIASFLTAPDGAFYVSQDADLSMGVPGPAYYSRDAEDRRRLGIPRVDRHVYSRENGWTIRALCRYYDVSGDAEALVDARHAVDWIEKHRAVGSGFHHDGEDTGGPFLDDSTAMAEAYVALYRSTGERPWLAKAQAVLHFIAREFSSADAGFIASPAPAGARGVFRAPPRPLDQNAAVARLANLVQRYSGDAGDRAIAEHAMARLAAIEPTDPGLHADILLADRELSQPPTHLAVVGAKSDPAARELHAAALAFPASYLQVDWWDPAEGPLPNPAVQYPRLARAALFACSVNACSTPIYAADQLADAVANLRSSD